MSEKRFLSTVEAAEYIGAYQKIRCVNTLATGIVPAHKFGDNLLNFDPTELDDAAKALGR